MLQRCAPVLESPSSTFRGDFDIEVTMTDVDIEVNASDVK